MPRETQQQRAKRALRIARRLTARYRAQTALAHENPFQLLIATILSAQCTDERVNRVTPVLFAGFGTPADLAVADPREIEEIIRSTGFFRAKTRHIQAAAQAIVNRHHGLVPRDLEELTAIKGVGRKTANVVLGSAFGIAAGIVVDTHVMRLSRRLGLTRHHDAGKIERDLMEIVPQAQWIAFSHRLIWHGRSLCTARRPCCAVCPLVPDCPAAREFLRRRTARAGETIRVGRRERRPRRAT